MSSPMNSPQIFDQVFLQLRAKILEVGAAFDRLSRAAEAESVGHDPRFAQLRECLEVLLSDEANRAAHIQQIFSDPYDPEWVEKFKATGTRPGLNPTVPH